jgi:nicotinate-nucleotide adenylyltransferase
LDRVWWLVSPGNPLKEDGPQPMEARIDAARQLVRDPRIVVSDIEARLGTRYTAATLAALMPLYPGVRFVWLMGADNLADFHRWHDWYAIAQAVPIGVLARPGHGLAALNGPAARTLRHARIGSGDARSLPHMVPPCWSYLPLPLRPESSTALRAGGYWPGGQAG